MRYFKQGTIRHRIIRYNDVLAIATFLEKIGTDCGGRITFSVDFRDSSTVSSSKINVFSPDMLKRKNIKSIDFEYQDIVNQRTLEIQLTEEYVFSDITNTYRISSSDETWYNATLAQLNELIGTVAKHMWIRHIFDFPQIFAGYFLYWVILCGIMVWPLGFEFGERTENAGIFISASAFFILGTFLFAAITLCVYFLFPDMEFRFETPRDITRKRIRKAAIWILGTIAIPIILSMFMR